MNHRKLKSFVDLKISVYNSLIQRIMSLDMELNYKMPKHLYHMLDKSVLSKIL